VGDRGFTPLTDAADIAASVVKFAAESATGLLPGERGNLAREAGRRASRTKEVRA
jgi:hypothetical protein